MWSFPLALATIIQDAHLHGKAVKQLKLKDDSVVLKHGSITLVDSELLVSGFREMKVISGERSTLYKSVPDRLKVEADSVIRLGNALDSKNDVRPVIEVRIGRKPWVSKTCARVLQRAAWNTVIFLVFLFAILYLWNLLIPKPTAIFSPSPVWVTVRNRRILGEDYVASVPIPFDIARRGNAAVDECIRRFLAEVEKLGKSPSFKDTVYYPYTPAVAQELEYAQQI